MDGRLLALAYETKEERDKRVAESAERQLASLLSAQREGVATLSKTVQQLAASLESQIGADRADFSGAHAETYALATQELMAMVARRFDNHAKTLEAFSKSAISTAAAQVRSLAALVPGQARRDPPAAR